LLREPQRTKILLKEGCMTNEAISKEQALLIAKTIKQTAARLATPKQGALAKRFWGCS
jgi:hypothetical protein